MLRIFRHEGGRLVPAQLEVGPQTQPAEADGAIWFDLLNPTREEDAFVEGILRVSVPTREEAEELEVSARLYHQDGAEFMTMTAVAQMDSEDPSTGPVTFILKGERLVTVRYSEPKPFAQFAARSHKANEVDCTSGEHIMLGLVEALIERMADALGQVGSSLEQMSRGVFRHRAESGSRSRNFQAILEQLGAKGDLLAMIRESLVSVGRLLSYHTPSITMASHAGKEAAEWTRDMQADVAALSDHASYLSNKTSFQLDATLGLINLEQNHLIKIFSIASVCLMPPTLIASIYGMNFEQMPELEWRIGYPLAILAMVISAIIPFAYFRRKGWL